MKRWLAVLLLAASQLHAATFHGKVTHVVVKGPWTVKPISVEKFLAKHLGGRYQESRTPAIAARMR